MSILKNAQEVLSGKRTPSELGVYAPDDFTFVADLRSSTSFFLKFVANYLYAAVPMHVVEAAQSRNAEMDGASVLRQQRSVHVAGSSALRTNRAGSEPTVL